MTYNLILARIASKVIGILPLAWRPRVRLRVSVDCRPSVRLGGSDMAVFKQVFLERQYAEGGPAGPIRTVIDCGANIGMATLWFLRQYPDARVIAIEPDSENFKLLTVNVCDVQHRVQLFHAGIWSRSCRLSLFRNRSAGEWASRTEESSDGDVRGISIAELLDQLGNQEIDILKVDIEGGECEMFQGDLSWLPRVRCMMIETHGPESEEVVARACRGFLEPVIRNGEIAVWRRPQ